MSKKIIVCGDAMWDHYWWGDVERISPEAPVPVVKITKKELRHGAAANVVTNCKAMGADVLDGTCKTSDKYRIVARSQHIVRVDFDHRPDKADVAWMEYYFQDNLDEVDIVIFSDYGKGTLDNIQDLILKAKEKQKIVLIDPKGHDYSKYRFADLIKPNKEELRQVIGGWTTDQQLDEKVRQMMAEHRIGKVLLTLAADGMKLFGQKDTHTIPAETLEIYDVTGAGDTAIAALAVGLSLDKTWLEAVRYANKAAGIVCGKIGTRTVTKEEVFGPD